GRRSLLFLVTFTEDVSPARQPEGHAFRERRDAMDRHSGATRPSPAVINPYRSRRSTVVKIEVPRSPSAAIAKLAAIVGHSPKPSAAGASERNHVPRSTVMPCQRLISRTESKQRQVAAPVESTAPYKPYFGSRKRFSRTLTPSASAKGATVQR